MMKIFIIARVIHVLGVVIWIGGVAMVTTVLLPAIKKMQSNEEKISLFEKIESRFALQAKITIIITGLSGFYMLYYLNMWHRYSEIKYWWLHAMTFVWLIFTLVLFVLEPLFLNRFFEKHVKNDPNKTFAYMHRLHWILLLLSLLAIAGGVIGSHGWLMI
jgi:uncharacterized membrane protein